MVSACYHTVSILDSQNICVVIVKTSDVPLLILEALVNYEPGTMRTD